MQSSLNFSLASTISTLEPESLYNNGKGIQVTASLIGLLPAPKAGDKRRANAKPPVTTKVVYIHEKTSFMVGLIMIIWNSMNQKDLCKGGLDRQGNLKEKTRALFSLEYTIPRTQLKDIELLSTQDWETFLDEAGKKPSVQGKLTIKEKLVSVCSDFEPFWILSYHRHLVDTCCR